MELFKLVGSIFIDTDDANNSMSKTTEKAESMAEKIGKGAKSVAKVGAATLAAGTAIAGAMISNAKSTASAADEVDKASIRMGIGAERYQELAYAAGQSGVEMSTLEKAAKKLEGTGINFDDALNSIMELETAEERAAAASEMFGDAVAYQMSPLIEQSGESFNGLIDRANDLGLVMSEDAVKSGVEFGDLMSDLEQSVKALGTGLGSALMPVLNEMIKGLIDFMPDIQSMITEIAPVLSDLMAELMPALIEIVKELLPPILDLVKALTPVLTELINAILPPLMSIIDALMPIIINIVETVLPPLVAIFEKLTPVIQFLAEVVGKELAGAFKVIEPIIESVKQYFNGLIEFITGVFTGDWSKAWQGVIDIFGGIFNGIVALVKTPLNMIINGINAVFSTLGSISLPDWVPFIGGKTIELPQIPMLAKGGTITGSGSVIVGERGPELLNLNSGASVVPLNGDAGLDSVVRAIEQSSSDMIDAIRRYASSSTIKVDDPYRIFKLVKDEEKKSNIMLGKA